MITSNSDGTQSLTDGGTVTLDFENSPDNKVMFSNSTRLIKFVFVKGPQASNSYNFGAGVTGESLYLTAPNNGAITSVTFCSQPTPATLKVVKNTVGGNGTFSYTAIGGGLSNFSIATSSGQGERVFANLTPGGTRTVTEDTPPTGWSFTSLACTDPDNGTTVSGQVATIDLDPGETVVCTYTNTMRPPSITVVKTAAPTSVPEQGGAVSFSVQVNNTGSVPVTLTNLVDDKFGNLAGQGNCATGATINVSGSYSCSFTRTISGDAGITHTNTVTATAGGATAVDDATVTVTDVKPTVDLTKTVTPATLAEPGGVFSYTLTIKNTSVEQVTITALTDNNLLSAQCTDLINTTLAAGASTSCSYTVNRTEAGSYPNTASVTVKDNENNPVSDTDSKTVTVTNILPTIEVTKTANPTSVPETNDSESTDVQSPPSTPVPPTPTSPPSEEPNERDYPLPTNTPTPTSTPVPAQPAVAVVAGATPPPPPPTPVPPTATPVPPTPTPVPEVLGAEPMPVPQEAIAVPQTPPAQVPAQLPAARPAAPQAAPAAAPTTAQTPRMLPTTGEAEGTQEGGTALLAVAALLMALSGHQMRRWVTRSSRTR